MLTEFPTPFATLVTPRIVARSSNRVMSTRARIPTEKVAWPLLIAVLLLVPGGVVTFTLVQQSESPRVPADVVLVDSPSIQPVILPLHVESSDTRSMPLREDNGQYAGAFPDDEKEEVSGLVDVPEDEGRLQRRLSRADVLAMLESTPRGLREPAWKPGASRDVLELTDSDLAGIDLEAADLTFVGFGESDLRGANLRNANLRNSNLSEANLAGAVLTGADLREVQMAFADLSGSDMRNVNASGVVPYDGLTVVVGMFGVNLRGADLRGADLSGVSILAADLREADLRGADLRGAIYDAETRFPEGLDPRSRGMRQRIWTPGG